MAFPLLRRVASWLAGAPSPKPDAKAVMGVPLVSSAIIGPEGSRRVSIPRDGRGFAKEGYSENIIAYRCVEIVTRGAASIPVYVVDKETKEALPKHPLQLLLNKPSPATSWADLIQAFLSFERITGNGFLEVLTADGIPRELIAWAPYDFSIKDNANSYLPQAYVYAADTRFHRTWEVDYQGRSDMFHFRAFNPLSKHFGLSPMQAAALSIDQHNFASQWNKDLLANGAAPSGALTTEQVISLEQFAQLKTQLEDSHTGPRNARRPMILDGGLSWQQFSMTMQDLDWLQGKKLSGQEIAAAYGVPSQVIPIEGSQTFANYAEARLALYEDTVIPLYRRFLDAFLGWIRHHYSDGERLAIEMDLDAVPALAGRRAELWKTANESKFLSINEKRQMVGYDELLEPEADQVFISGAEVPLGVELPDPPPAKPAKPDDAPTDDAPDETGKALILALTRSGMDEKTARRLARKVLA